MLPYTPPEKDIEFVLYDLFDAETEWAKIPAFGSFDRGTVGAILTECGKLTSDIMAPLSQSSDEEGAHWDNGVVTAPEGFKDAYDALAAGGWLGVSGNPAFGGQGLPKMLTVSLEEMFWGANTNLWLYATLTVGAAICVDAHADEVTRRLYLPKFYSGAWTGAMALTEAHAGTDLGLIRTRAIPRPDGSYRITGTKIFITSGEHDLAENIVHLVLAKLPDAPGGSRGISLFLVPKYLPRDDGSLGDRNGLESVSIEHKMGVKGSATSVISYTDATAYLIGEPNQGLACMFTMMNYERLSVGIQGLGLAERAYQASSSYAKERVQGRVPEGPRAENTDADAIVGHPDVRRMLLTQRAYNEGGRAFSTYVGLQLDLAKYASDGKVREKASRFVDLLTPVAKAFITDRGLECTLLGQQVFGGHGYIREWGVEQLVRDVRIAQIYEGANGIQALDLVGRKVLRDGGATVVELIDDIRQTEVLEQYTAPLDEALVAWQEVTRWLCDKAPSDSNLPGAASVDYLDMTGHVLYAWLWARMAGVSDSKDKRYVADYYFAKLLPRYFALEASIRGGSESLMEPSSNWF
ncbi:MAG: acyl-CoA dehydrogenase C-terminal domain-containing protein [Pseudomonadota bacterium]|nr:acyl-CoA dehydrogenase C-terminal domain-containing protein [Pseudomonadota bacterium]